MRREHVFFFFAARSEIMQLIKLGKLMLLNTGIALQCYLQNCPSPEEIFPRGLVVKIRRSHRRFRFDFPRLKAREINRILTKRA